PPDCLHEFGVLTLVPVTGLSQLISVHFLCVLHSGIERSTTSRWSAASDGYKRLINISIKNLLFCKGGG
ncbi:hypothetical protein, partial [Clostridioides difficile]|uniref:hypothetical protein n=1 Tax=Clostridioides difficile TaxID=1496 RepID=UPI001596EDFE